MSTQNATVEYVMRAKLPADKPPHPEEAVSPEYRDAIFANLPAGFEIHWPSKNEWPQDKDGWTWVRLSCTDATKAVEYFNSALATAKATIAWMKKKAAEIAG